MQDETLLNKKHWFRSDPELRDRGFKMVSNVLERVFILVNPFIKYPDMISQIRNDKKERSLFRIR